MAITLKAIAAGTTADPTKWQEVDGGAYASYPNATVSATASTKTILLTGDRHLEFTTGVTFVLTDNVNSNVECTVASNATFSAPDTIIVVTETIANGTAGHAMLHRVPDPNEETTRDIVDLNSWNVTQVGAAFYAGLVDSYGDGGGVFEITDDFTCRGDCEAPLSCNTTKAGNVPIAINVFTITHRQEPAFENKACGLVDVGYSMFVNMIGNGVYNVGMVVGVVLYGTGDDDYGVVNEGFIVCPNITGAGPSGGIYNSGVIVGDCHGEGNYSEGIVNSGTITGTVEAISSQIVNYGTITGAVEAICSQVPALTNSSTINLIGELNVTSVTNNGTIKSAYTKPPTDIIGAGML